LIPEQYGGAGLPLRAGCVILEEIHAGGCSAAACHAQMYMMGTLLRHGSAEQKQRYLPKIATGEIRFQAFGVTEPTTGSDTTQLKTRAVRNGDHYVVNGQKLWTSRAHKSDLMTLLVRTTPVEEVKRRTEGLSVLLVEMRDAVGKSLTIRRIDTMINHQTNELFFDDLKVPAQNLIGEEGQGFRYILDGMNAERILLSGEMLGDARWFIARASAYAKERVVFGRPIGKNQSIQHPLAENWSELYAAELMTLHAAELYDAGKPCGAQANAAKYLAADAGFRACDRAMRTHGGMGYAAEFHIERYFREMMAVQLAPVSREMILCFIAERELGLPKSY
jgi:acyl-CoA dehydrogenase